MTFGFGDDCETQIVAQEDGFRLVRRAESSPLIRHQLHGRHMVANIAGAVVMARTLDVEWAPILAAAADFHGLARRFETVATVGGVRVIDDFAHHPTAIAATVEAARSLTSGRLTVVLEPQLFSRAAAMAPAYAGAVAQADATWLLPVNGAGKADDGGAGNAAVSAALTARGVDFTAFAQAGLADAVRGSMAGDTVLVMSGRPFGDLAQTVVAGLTAAPDGIAAPALQIGAPLGDDVAPENLIALFIQRAAQQPDAPAVMMNGVVVNYGGLLARAQAIAAALIGQGLQAGGAVAVCLRASPDRVSAFLGVLLAGGVYLPVDPDLPELRQRFMLDDAAARHVLCDARMAPALTEGRVRLQPETLSGGGAVTPSMRADAPAYIIYTSGTTGRPKGVVVPHGALARFAVAARDRFQIAASSRVSLFSAFGFDVHVGDMAMAMAAGACLVLLPDGQVRAGGTVTRCVEASGITHLSLTPSAAATLSLPRHGGLSHLILIGEACPPDLVTRWRRHGVAVINSYGPAEATVAVTAADCQAGEAVTIGTAFPDTGIYIAGDDLQPVARGETGELCIFGPCLASGYLNQPALTARKFPKVTLDGVGRVRIYRTGDRAAMRPDGQILFLGRDDDQIKLRGFRIEPGEIEAVLRRSDGVRDAWVRLWRNNGAGRLVAYVVGEALDEGRLRRRLDRILPAHMMPDLVIRVDDLPLTANGKRDMAALPAPGDGRTAGREPKLPVTPVEIRLAGIYRDSLSLDVFGIRDTLAELGADSLQTATLFAAIETAFDITLAFDRIDEVNTIELMALHIEARVEPAARTAPPDNLGADLIRKQAAFIAAWEGQRATPRQLIVSRNAEGSRPPLFWCFQGAAELAELAERLGPEQPVHGLRSGHLIMTTNPANLDALAHAYADELTALYPRGPVVMGGNCQGAGVARHLALELRSRGRDMARLILMEQGRFLPYGGPVALIFGRDSQFNPFGLLDDPHTVFRAAYPGGYSVDLIDGAHGQYFRPPNSYGLAKAVRRQLLQPATA